MSRQVLYIAMPDTDAVPARHRGSDSDAVVSGAAAGTYLDEVASIEDRAKGARHLVWRERQVADALEKLRTSRNALLAGIVSVLQVPQCPGSTEPRSLGESTVAKMVSKHTAKAVDRQVVHRARGAKVPDAPPLRPGNLDAATKLAAQLIELVRAGDLVRGVLRRQMATEIIAVLDELGAEHPSRFTYHDKAYARVVDLLYVKELDVKQLGVDADHNTTTTRPGDGPPPQEMRTRVNKLRRRVREIQRRTARSSSSSTGT